MRTDRELLQDALKLIEYGIRSGEAHDITEEIRARLAEKDDEPVAWLHTDKSVDMLPLYLRPHRRLSDEEICEIAGTSRAVEGKAMLPVTFARAIETAIWEKNQ